MATPFHADWPCQIAPYPALSSAAAGKRASGVFSSCRQTMSGASRSSQASSAASRVWMPLTLKVAIFRVSTACLRE